MFKSALKIAVILALAVNVCGCALLIAGAAGGVGTALWLSGKLSDEVSAPYERTVNATKRAIESLDMKVDKESKSDEVTQIRSEYIDGSEVWIDIRPLTQTASKVEVRVGVTGDKTASAKILERIKKYSY
ncbi:MAG: DUF3568 family protein [Candidatus Omnitrophota bacterium]|jgi:hypothetical protein|nr:MAG: DUF3568 family protein [Candidatus Omnitrophota bacterium]